MKVKNAFVFNYFFKVRNGFFRVFYAIVSKHYNCNFHIFIIHEKMGKITQIFDLKAVNIVKVF